MAWAALVFLLQIISNLILLKWKFCLRSAYHTKKNLILSCFLSPNVGRPISSLGISPSSSLLLANSSSNNSSLRMYDDSCSQLMNGSCSTDPAVMITPTVKIEVDREEAWRYERECRVLLLKSSFLATKKKICGSKKDFCHIIIYPARFINSFFHFKTVRESEWHEDGKNIFCNS